ncbi:hypothetical protein AVEN_208346-1 [Araneus ventricosus]|uniref:Uncharacterized protein n=1 Tax=Araneus ventricosus TaxID=182803 RepID=A0A4Y2FE35_ARAVE|nr:hypothetical protein AVEN_208346-1 [Araneus ventricosus]
MRTRPNFSPRQSTFVPRPQNSFFRPNFLNISKSRPNNFANSHSNTFMNQGFRPNHNAYFQNRLSSSPCRIFTRQGIPNAYHWTQLCPLRQPQFTCDLPIANNSVSQCTGNSFISSQVTNDSENTANDRQNPSTEASGQVYWQLLVSGHISTLPNPSNLVHLPMSHTLLDNVNIVIDTGSTLPLISPDIVNKLNLPIQHTRPVRVNQAQGNFQFIEICVTFIYKLAK